jgi:VIT1/CCC1 family predicted Fe2+/Mn2+ transporter
MLVNDLFAASIPVLPYAFLGLAAARITSLAVTLALRIGPGIGRARIGHRRVPPTVVETITIALRPPRPAQESPTWSLRR